MVFAEADRSLARPIAVGLAHTDPISPQEKASPADVDGFGVLGGPGEPDAAIPHGWRLTTVHYTWKTK